MPPPPPFLPPEWVLGLTTVLFAVVTVIWVYLGPSSSRGWGLLALGLAVAALVAGISSAWTFFPLLQQGVVRLVGALMALAVVGYVTYLLGQWAADTFGGGWSSGPWTYIGYVLAALAALVLLALVWIWFGAQLQAQTGMLGLVVQLIFALPCLIAWLAQYVVNDFRGTAPATLLLLAVETAILGAFVFRRPLERAARAVAGWVLPPGLLTPTDRVVTRLQTDRVFLNYETRLGNRPLPEGAPETKSQLTPTRSLGQNQDYRVTFEVYLHALDLGAGAAFPVLRYAEGSTGGGCPSVYFEGAGAPGAGGGSIWSPSSSGAEGFRQVNKLKQQQKKLATTVVKKKSVAVVPPPPKKLVAAIVKKPVPPPKQQQQQQQQPNEIKATPAAAAPAADQEDEKVAADTAPSAAPNTMDEDAFVPNVLAVDNDRNWAQLRIFPTNTIGPDDAPLLVSVSLQRWVELAFYYTRTQVDVFVDRRLIYSLPWRPDNRPVFGPGDQFVVGSPVPNGAALGSLRNLAVETPYPLIAKHGGGGGADAEKMAAETVEAAIRAQVQKNSAELN